MITAREAKNKSQQAMDRWRVEVEERYSEFFLNLDLLIKEQCSRGLYKTKISIEKTEESQRDYLIILKLLKEQGYNSAVNISEKEMYITFYLEWK